MRSRRSIAARWALLASLAIGVAACPAAQAPPPAPPEPAPQPIATPAPVEQTAVTPVEAGFVHCCGNGSYRIEIDCRQMMKRCYTSETGTWHQTYGRHCRASLGESCYLQDCDAKCQ